MAAVQTQAPEAKTAPTVSRAVLIVDDHPLYRCGLKDVLGELPASFTEAGSLGAAIDHLGERRFDLILYDWHLPGGGGCKGLLAICQLAPEVPVVVISADEDEAIRIAAASIGALGCLSKGSDAAHMREVLGAVLERGHGGLPRVATGRCPPGMPPAPMTSRQREVLRLMARGDPNKRIASRLGIAESTVRAHVSDILQLLRARNRTEAVILAQRRSLLRFD